MKDPSKTVRRRLRELAGIAYERELNRELDALFKCFEAWKKDEISPFDLSENIHEFHQKPARDPETGWDIWILSMEGDRNPEPFLKTRFNEFQPALSPDGKRLAYVSNESGSDEIYATPFPGPGGKSQISTDGGREPAWAPSGRELFYRDRAQGGA
jgi:Tol biopolymer transport system component